MDAVDEAIRILTEDADEHWLQRLPHARHVVADQFVASAYRHRVPVYLLVAMAHYESFFTPSVRGRLGETGIMQVHGVAARGCDLETTAGQIDCGAKWLRYGVDVCGNPIEALALYGTGECLVVPEVSQFVIKRARLWGHLERFHDRYASRYNDRGKSSGRRK